MERKVGNFDALSPKYLAQLVTKHIAEYIDVKQWASRQKEIEGVKKKLKYVAGKWDEL